MKKLILALIAMSYVSLPLQAWEEYKPDVTQEKFAERRTGVDHLEPIPAPARLPESYYIAQYIVIPSFTPGKRLTVFRNDKAGKYYIRVWNKIDSNDLNKEIPFSSEIEIPEEIASLIYDIWVNVLLEVRYSRYAVGGLDGTTYVFSTFVRSLGWMHGSTWSPRLELPPKWMIETGEYLFQMTEQRENDFENNTKQLEEFRSRLLVNLEKNGKH